MDAKTFTCLALGHDANRIVLERLPDLGLPDCWLVAGCIFQAVWNLMTGRAAGDSIRDYDVFYFDGEDLSYEAENAVIRRAETLFTDIGVKLDVKNQARVHLWYEERFGARCLPLQSTADGIARFPVMGTCVGLAVGQGGVDICAPHGLGDIAEGILRPNALTPATDLFEAKAASYRARWPWLKIVTD